MSGDPVLFLDIDGVLNDHAFNGIDQRKTAILNIVLDRLPTLKIVVSSAWRHYINEGHMTLKGFEIMLRACGLHCGLRLSGHTEDDGTDFQNCGRANLIRKYAKDHNLSCWVAIDDEPLTLPNTHFIQTNGDLGITQRNADDLLAMLRNAARVPDDSEEKIDRFMIRRQQA